MKKILFVVCTHGDEQAGMELFYHHPYGRTDQVEWKVVIGNPEAFTLSSRIFEEDLNRVASLSGDTYERRRAAKLKELMQGFDVVYDIHTTTDFRTKVQDSIFINTLDSLPDTKCAAAQQVIFDSKDNENYVTALHPNGITLEYCKTKDVAADKARILADFQRIIKQEEMLWARTLSEFEKLISQEVAAEHHFQWSDFEPIPDSDRVALGLPEGKYLPVFVNVASVDPKTYAALNRCI